MSLMDLFTSFQGRISRRNWWFGTLVLLCVGLAGSYLTEPGAFGLDRPGLPSSHLGRAAWTAILLYPALALALKRLQDRDQPDWVGQLLIVVALGSFAVLQLGFVQDPLQARGPDRLIFLAAALFQLWVVIDNGFLKGTPGSNRHGPDPLAPARRNAAQDDHGAAERGRRPRLGRQAQGRHRRPGRSHSRARLDGVGA